MTTPTPTIFEQPEHRLEGRQKVTGALQYTADRPMPKVLWAGFVYSPYPHARILKVDVEAARRVRGVRAVLSAADLGGAHLGRTILDWPVLAIDRVRFIGDRVVAVAAETKESLAEALTLVEVGYEQLPAVLDPRAALAQDAPILHPDREAYAVLSGERPVVDHPNIQGRLIVTTDDRDIEEALASADVVVESHYTTPRHHHGAIEPHAAMVWTAQDGTIHVASTNKAPFPLVRQLAAGIGVPPERIDVDNQYVGGDFGGKGFSLDEYACYFLSRATGRPVRSVVDYADELSTINTRHPAIVRMRTGVNRDGRFVAHAAEVLFDGGAYAAAKPLAHGVPPSGTASMAAYVVPHTRIELTTVYTNTVPGGHVRVPGGVQAVFASESHIDEIARDVGFDPAELRRRNTVRDGETNAVGLHFRESAGVAVLDRATEAIGWHEPREGCRGVGLSLYQRGSGSGRAAVLLRALEDGSYVLVTGAVDQGAGTHTALRRIVAAELGVHEDSISVRFGTTSHAPFDSGAGADRVTRIVGQAARQAAEEMRERLAAGGSGSLPIEVTGEHEAPRDSAGASFIATAFAVAVDLETGAVHVEDAVIVVDVGPIINPTAHRGQLQGGFAFGWGAAVMEELSIEGGQITSGSLGDYKLPTIADVPPLRIIHVRGPDGPGPFGTKAVGELSNAGVPPALANAIADATGVRLTSLPLKAEDVLAGIVANSDG